MAMREEAIKRVQRFSDVDQEPLELFSPISGYEKMPLVTLEEAVEKLVHLLPAVPSHAYIAKQRCKKPADGLSSDESASIMLYTMGWEPLDECLYVVLNATLRSKDREKLKPWFLYLRLFVSGLSRLPPLRDTVYRGVKLDLSHEYPTGKTIVWWGFSSCTTNLSVLQSELFLGKEDTRTIFTIKCESARDIQKHSYYPSEDEVLLLAATQFEVTGCLDQGELCIIQLKQTQPPVPLLQPVPIVTTSTSLLPSVPVSSKIELTATTTTNSTISSIGPTAVLPPASNYHNFKLEQIITEKKDDPELNLSCKQLTDQDVQFVVYHALQKKQTITTVILKYCQINEQGAQYLAKALREKTTLTTLDLSDNQIGAQGTRHLSETIRYNTTLTMLNIDRNQVGDEGVQYLATALQENTVRDTLTYLSLSGNQIGSQGARYLSGAIQHNMTLTLLYLDKNRVGNHGIRHLATALQTNKALAQLRLSDNQIGVEGAQYLADALKQNTTLTLLYIYRNEIGDKGTQYLAEALRYNTALTAISLDSNHIGDKGAQYLAEALQHNTALQKLHLYDNNFGAKGLQSLNEALQKSKTLTKMTLSKNLIGDK